MRQKTDRRENHAFMNSASSFVLVPPGRKATVPLVCFPIQRGTHPLEPAAGDGMSRQPFQPITSDVKMLQAFSCLQILLAEYLAMVRSEWSTKMLTVEGVDDMP